MRVAVVGTGGLAYWICHYIKRYTGHQLIVLSRTASIRFRQQGFQTLAVDYNSPVSIEYALTGVDVVVSTVRDPTAQIHLIDCAASLGVRRFTAAEFEGIPPFRDNPDLEPDLDRRTVREHLLRSGLETTIFVCGLLYERFGAGGLRRYHMALDGANPRYQQNILNYDQMTAEIPLTNTTSEYVSFCMTAARDVGRYVARSIDLERWPALLTMRGDRLSSAQLLQAVSNVRGTAFNSRNVIYHTPPTLRDATHRAIVAGDAQRLAHCQHLISIQDGQYDYSSAELNRLFPDIVPTRFEQWLRETARR